MCGRSGKLRLCVLYVYSIVVFIGYIMYSVSAQGIVGRVINARYYYYCISNVRLSLKLPSSLGNNVVSGP